MAHPHANRQPDCEMLSAEENGSNGNGLSGESGVQQRGNGQLESGVPSSSQSTQTLSRQMLRPTHALAKAEHKTSRLLSSLWCIIGT